MAGETGIPAAWKKKCEASGVSNLQTILDTTSLQTYIARFCLKLQFHANQRQQPNAKAAYQAILLAATHAMGSTGHRQRLLPSICRAAAAFTGFGV